MSIIRKCLFPAAGYGTRFLPATKAMPKEMLPILTKPLIQYAVEEAVEAGIYEMAFVTGRGKRALEDHFDISYELEHQIKGTDKEKRLADIRDIIDKCTFSYTRQHEMRGLGHAVLKGEVLVSAVRPFAVVLADDLCINPDGENVLSQMVKLYEKYQCSIVAVMEIENKDTKKYGIVEGIRVEDGVYRVKKTVEKPEPKDAPSNLAIIGRYILTPDIFDKIKNTKPGSGGEIQITDALQKQAEEGNVIAYKFKGRRYDCGQVEGYVKAITDFYEMRAKS